MQNVLRQNSWVKSGRLLDSTRVFQGMAGQMNGCDSVPEFRDESTLLGKADVSA
jgi:hypothetical protein